MNYPKSGSSKIFKIVGDYHSTQRYVLLNTKYPWPHMGQTVQLPFPSEIEPYCVKVTLFKHIIFFSKTTRFKLRDKFC